MKRKKLIGFISFILIFGILVGCSTTTEFQELVRFDLDITSDGGGTVEKTPDQDAYKKGTQVTLTVKPKEYWNFTKWTGDIEGTETKVDITVDENIKAIAHFTISDDVVFTLKSSKVGEGTVAVKPEKDSYQPGETVAVTATPETNWNFVYWDGSVTEEQKFEKEIEIYMDNNKTLTAVFEKDSEKVGIIFEDPDLEEAIRDKINKQTGPIKAADVANIETLLLEAERIDSLVGMEYLTSLTTLELNDNYNIKDISPLAGLTKLTTLNLENNQVDNIEPLRNLTNLEHINLNNNLISDLTPLKGFMDDNLRILEVAHNPVFNQEIVSNLTSLERLNLAATGLDDIRILTGLTNLTDVNLSSNAITDISAFEEIELTKLEKLDLSDNMIDSIEEVVWFFDESLREFNLSKNNISDINFVQGLDNLEILDLSDNDIINIKVLTLVPTLKELYLKNNQIGAIQDEFADMDKISILDFNNNQLVDIEILRHMGGLTYVDLGDNTPLKDSTATEKTIEDLRAKGVDVIYY
mgnify:CR=1 FL=1